MPSTRWVHLVLAAALAACTALPQANRSPRPSLRPDGASSAKPGASVGPSAQPRAEADAAASRSLPARLGLALPASLVGAQAEGALAGQDGLVAPPGSFFQALPGGRIVANHGGGILSDQAGALIGNNGGGLIGNQGGGLVGDQGGAYRLSQKLAFATDDPRVGLWALLALLDLHDQQLVAFLVAKPELNRWRRFAMPRVRLLPPPQYGELLAPLLAHVADGLKGDQHAGLLREAGGRLRLSILRLPAAQAPLAEGRVVVDLAASGEGGAEAQVGAPASVLSLFGLADSAALVRSSRAPDEALLDVRLAERYLPPGTRGPLAEALQGEDYHSAVRRRVRVLAGGPQGGWRTLMGRGDLSFPPSAPQGRRSQDLFSLGHAAPGERDVGVAFTQRRHKALVGVAFGPFVWVGLKEEEAPGDGPALPRFVGLDGAIASTAGGPWRACCPPSTPPRRPCCPPPPPPKKTPPRTPICDCPRPPPTGWRGPKAPEAEACGRGMGKPRSQGGDWAGKLKAMRALLHLGLCLPLALAACGPAVAPKAPESPRPGRSAAPMPEAPASTAGPVASPGAVGPTASPSVQSSLPSRFGVALPGSLVGSAASARLKGEGGLVAPPASSLVALADGRILSNNGGSLVSNHGAGIVSNHSGAWRHLLQDPALAIRNDSRTQFWGLLMMVDLLDQLVFAFAEAKPRQGEWRRFRAAKGQLLPPPAGAELFSLSTAQLQAALRELPLAGHLQAEGDRLHLRLVSLPSEGAPIAEGRPILDLVGASVADAQGRFRFPTSFETAFGMAVLAGRLNLKADGLVLETGEDYLPFAERTAFAQLLNGAGPALHRVRREIHLPKPEATRARVDVRRGAVFRYADGVAMDQERSIQAWGFAPEGQADVGLATFTRVADAPYGSPFVFRYGTQEIGASSPVQPVLGQYLGTQGEALASAPAGLAALMPAFSAEVEASLPAVPPPDRSVGLSPEFAIPPIDPQVLAAPESP